MNEVSENFLWCPIVIETNFDLLTQWAAKPIYWHWFGVKQLRLLKGIHYEAKHGDQATYAQKTWNFPLDFLGRIFKVRVRERLTECVVSLGTILWLVDGEVTRWWFENLNHQHSGSNQKIVSDLYVCGQCAVNIFYIVGVLVSAKLLKDLAQNIICRLWVGTEGT